MKYHKLKRHKLKLLRVNMSAPNMIPNSDSQCERMIETQGSDVRIWHCEACVRHIKYNTQVDVEALGC